MAATIVSGNIALKTLFSSNSGKKVGVCTARITSEEHADNKISIDALYTLTKMRTLDDITICAILERPTQFNITGQDIIDNVTNKLNDFLCDYVYIDTDQLNDSTQVNRENRLFSPFVESEGICQITRYLPYNMPFPLGTEKVVNDVNKRKYIAQLPYFRWFPTTGNFYIKNQSLLAIQSGININTSTLEEVYQVVSTISPYYRILNLNGVDATIDDLRAGKAIVFMYDSAAERDINDRKLLHRVCWLGFNSGDLFDFSTKTFERNVLDTEIDDVLNEIWGTAESTTIDDVYFKMENFREDIKNYYWEKKNK
jgi:hypothetical protein